MMRISVLSLALFAASASTSVDRSTGGPVQKLFLDSVEGPLVVDVPSGALRIRKVALTGHGGAYSVDGITFPLDWKQVRKNRKALDVTSRLSIRLGTLLFDGEAVYLPAGVKMRNVWGGVLWNGWALCLGRTSNTDREASYEPPSFSTELVAFKPADRKATVRYLTFNPPLETAIKILEGRPRKK